jgi:hypothetical protein
MCSDCQATRGHGSGPYPVMTRAQMRAGLDLLPCRRYDAARTVEGFSGRLQDEIDLDTLATELLAVVDQTMQPTAVSLWLRPRHRRHRQRKGDP